MASYVLISDYEVLQDIANKIKKKRISLNISQEDVAIKTGLSKHTISNIENGNSYTMDSFIKVMRYLGMISNLETVISDIIMDPNKIKGGQAPKRVKMSKKKETGNWTWAK